MPAESAADLAGMFDADEFAVSATWRAGGAGDGVAVSVIVDQPDETALAFGANIRSATRLLRLPVASAPTLAKGDTFTIGAQVLTVAALRRDAPDAATWMVEC